MKRVFHLAAAENSGIIQPVLNIRIGEKHLATAISDHASGQLKQLSYHTDEEYIGAEQVRAWLGSEDLRGPAFYEVQVGYDYPGQSLVPAQVLKQEDAGSIRWPGISPALLITESIPEWQLYNVYPVPSDIHQLMAENFPAAKGWNQFTIGLKNMRSVAAGGHLRVDIRHHDFTVLAVRSGTCLLAETFPYSTPEDMLYYLLKISARFALSQNEVLLELSGLIDRESSLYKELYQYYVQVRFRDAGWKMTDSAHPAHFFTPLNDLALCAS